MKINELLNEFKAYHGSSRRFDRFSLSKALSGEGNMSYGYGIYIAGNSSTGKHYAMVAHEANKARISSKKGELSAIEYKLSTPPRRDKPLLSPEERKQLINDKQKLQKEITDFESGLGRKLFQVDVSDKIIPYLFDLDKTLSEQTSQVKKSLENLDIDINESITGFKLLKQLENSSTVQAATEKLQSAGIAGTKYFDALSRTKGSGSYNYVIFDPENITILNITEI